MKSDTRTAVPWLNPNQAAVHLGFVFADGSPNIRAFRQWAYRYKPRVHWLGGRMRFRQVDLDSMVEAAPEAPAFRVVAGGKR